MIMNNLYLKNLTKDIKFILISFLITLSAGILTGMIYVIKTTESKPTGIIEHYNGQNEFIDEDISKWDEIPQTKKYLHDMLETTHTHVTSFAIISILIGAIFYLNSIINNKIKILLIIEPFISTLITFSSLWIMRYVNDSFAYLVMFSAMLLYPCWLIMIGVSLYELLFIKK